MSNRNAPCPCGSGQKYKQCCNAVSRHADRVGTIVQLNQRVQGHEPGTRLKVDSVCGERFSLSEDGHRVLTGLHESFLLLPKGD